VSLTPLSPPRLNKIPNGLLGFLGIKNGGHNPEELAPQLSAGFELFHWYTQTNREFFRTAINLTALGQTTFFTVPAGEWWYVLHASLVTSVLGAGQTLQAAIGFTDAPGLRTIIVQNPPPSRTVGQVFTCNASGFWVGPGDTIGPYVTELAAGPIVSPVFTLSVARALV